MVAALQVLGIMQRTGKPLSELCKVMDAYPQTLVNIQVKKKPPLEELTTVQKAIEAVKEKLGEEGRVLVRYSGTEKKARVMVEGADHRSIGEYAEEIASAMRKEIGA